jgi:hypothetical protein
MNATNGYYSLVRYCPDSSRQEFVNIGVAIYSPLLKQVKILCSHDNRRISQVFGKQDLYFINRLKKSLEESLKRESFGSVSELEGYIGRSANAIQLGPLRSLKVCNIDDDIARLFERLVGERQERRPLLQRDLGQKLSDAGVERFVQKAVSIDIPSFDQSIRVPYAYQNGRYNLISPVEFAADLRDIFSKAGEKAIEGRELSQTTDPKLGELHLVVVARFASETRESARAKISEIFTEHNVEMHSFDNIDPLVEDIRKAAVQHGLDSAAD